MLNQSPIISGSITIKNLSFTGKEIIKALLEQGIAVDIEGNYLRIGSKSVHPESGDSASYAGLNPEERSNHQETAIESDYCPFYSKIEFFSQKIESLSEMLRDLKFSQDNYSKNISQDSLFSRTPSYYNKNQLRATENYQRKEAAWQLPVDDLQKANDFLSSQKSDENQVSLFPGEITSEKMACTNCGMPLSKNSVFCNHCGTEL